MYFCHTTLTQAGLIYSATTSEAWHLSCAVDHECFSFSVSHVSFNPTCYFCYSIFTFHFLSFYFDGERAKNVRAPINNNQPSNTNLNEWAAWWILLFFLDRFFRSQTHATTQNTENTKDTQYTSTWIIKQCRVPRFYHREVPNLSLKIANSRIVKTLWILSQQLPGCQLSAESIVNTPAKSQSPLLIISFSCFWYLKGTEFKVKMLSYFYK